MSIRSILLSIVIAISAANADVVSDSELMYGASSSTTVASDPATFVSDVVAVNRTVIPLTYTGTNVYTNPGTNSIFSITLTNNVTLVLPTNLVNGMNIRWRITQGTGTNTMTPAAGFVFPAGITNLTLSTAPGAVDILIAEAIATNRALLTGMLKFNP